MQINNDLFFNIVQDWKKKDIDNISKANFINEYINEKHISLRELSRQINIPHSTLQDWVSNRQVKKYYEKKENEFDTLLERLTFLMKKDLFKPTKKSVQRMEELKVELDKWLGLTLI